ncbi:universal stress protein [Streptomyces sp. MUM 203J]|uniref:universal stress protein n=1 Tax=Streptomyces sp. MUM 203J TaxID=2791990 RepID=UPI001F041413|nr:universal stress protein [Streptomyces sp. MUM 203J]MCH0541611.1 universal stress protein [Streptomyces sp. MUM 203J]
MSRPVTVGLDGSRESLAAVEWAAREAGTRGVPLRLLHVGDLGPDVHTPVVSPGTRRHWTERIPRETAERVRKDHPDLEVEPRWLPGDPAEVLCEAAEAAELLVVGSRGLGALAGFITGSVSLPLVARSGRPVVLVRAGGADGPVGGVSAAADDTRTGPGPADGRVVLGVDIDHPCDELLEFAFAHADRHRTALHVVHDWHLPMLYGPEPVAPAVALQEELAAAKNEALAQSVRGWSHRYPDVEVTHDCRLGRPVPHLLKAGRGAGLVVVGRRRRRARFGAHLGSVTHAVLHHCEAPVAVVPHD